MMSFRPVLFVLGILLVVLAVGMIGCAVLDVYFASDDWKVFAISAFFTAFIGGALILSNQGSVDNISLKQAFILTNLSWIVLAAFATLPFMLSEYRYSFTDAYFEVMSGLTTTGASVFSGLDTMPKGILLWRSMLTAIGGIGIVVMALAILPMLKIGGMQLFRTESSDKSDKVMPRATQLSAQIALVYFILVGACAFCYWFFGMSTFDAICHSFATISTAGFSTHDASFIFFNSVPIEVTGTIFMLLGGMPFVLFVQCMNGSYKPLFTDSQVRWYLSSLFIVIAIMVLWEHLAKNMPLTYALRHASFNIVSVATSTGFASADYTQWSALSIILFFFITVGLSCTGSTGGGIKMFRFQILHEIARSQVYQLFQPHGVFRSMFNGKPISESVSSSVLSFFILYALSFAVVAILLSFSDLDFIASMSASATALSNTGPGLGPIIGPVGNYSTLSDYAKWVISFAMLLGRLELFTVLVLLTPKFWRN